MQKFNEERFFVWILASLFADFELKQEIFLRLDYHLSSSQQLRDIYYTKDAKEFRF